VRNGERRRACGAEEESENETEREIDCVWEMIARLRGR